MSRHRNNQCQPYGGPYPVDSAQVEVGHELFMRGHYLAPHSGQIRLLRPPVGPRGESAKLDAPPLDAFEGCDLLA